MSILPFGRSRKARKIDDAPDRSFTDAERKTLKQLRSKRFRFFDETPKHDQSLSGIKDRPYHRQEKELCRRAIRLLAASSLRHDQETALRLAECTFKRPCREALCWLCKHRYVQDRQRQSLKVFQKVPQNQLRFVTVLVCAIGDGGSIHDVDATIKAIKAAFRDALRNATAHSALKAMQWMGSFEVDTYRSEDIDLQSRKGRTLSGIKGFNAACDQLLRVVHFHLLVALNGAKEKALRDLLKRLFPGEWRVEVKKLQAKESKQENIQHLAAYMSKCHPVYQDATRASDKAPPRGSGRYDQVFDDNHLLYHARLQAHLGGLGGTLKFDRGL